MAVEQGPEGHQFWCEKCQQVCDGSEVVFYVDLGRMHLKCRSGRVQPLEQAHLLGLVRQSG